MHLKYNPGFARMALAGIALPLVLAGCATTGSVKRAQASADEALARANSAGDAAQHAQGSADAAMNSAQHAQSTADGATSAAQGAGNTAQQALAAGQGTDGRISAIEARLHRLEHERMRHERRGHHGRRHHRHHRGGAATGPNQAKAH